MPSVRPSVCPSVGLSAIHSKVIKPSLAHEVKLNPLDIGFLAKPSIFSLADVYVPTVCFFGSPAHFSCDPVIKATAVEFLSLKSLQL